MAGDQSAFLDRIADPGIRELAARSWPEYQRCRACPRECGADRLAGERGSCGASLLGEVFYAGLLVNEERDLNPAYEVFFTGCPLSCRFCYLAEKVRGGAPGILPLVGHPLFDDPGLREARTICAVGGEPGVNLLAALYLFGTAGARPRVWNTNLYYADWVAEAAGEVADVVIGDLHFGNDVCAERLANAPAYLATVAQNLARAVASGAEVIVRHLVLPGHVECCALPAIRLVAEKFPAVRFHLLGQYLAPGRAQAGECRELLGTVSLSEMSFLERAALAAGLRLEPEPRFHEDAPGFETGLAGQESAARESGEIIIEPDGRVIVPHLTPGLLAMAQELREGRHE